MAFSNKAMARRANQRHLEVSDPMLDAEVCLCWFALAIARVMSRIVTGCSNYLCSEVYNTMDTMSDVEVAKEKASFFVVDPLKSLMFIVRYYTVEEGKVRVTAVDVSIRVFERPVTLRDFGQDVPRRANVCSREP